MSLLDDPQVGPAPATQRSARLRSVLLGGSLAAWWIASRSIDSHDYGPLGLVANLPLLWWAAAAAVVLLLLHAILRGASHPLIATHLAALVLVLYGTPGIAEHNARIPTGYVHVGLVEQIVRTGGVLRGYDARFSWPGGLGLGALVSLLGGLRSATSLLKWSPVAFTLADLVPMWIIAGALGLSGRRRWLAMTLFVSTNWVGQDYWSPQAFAFTLHLCGLAVVLRLWPRSGQRWGSAPAARRALVGAVVLITGALAFGHQLTPFAFVISVVVITATRGRDLGRLPVIVTLLVAGWVSWGATEYWLGNRAFLTGDIGRPDAVVGRGVADRVRGLSTAHDLVIYGRIGFALAMWGLALLAWLSWRRRSRSNAQLVGALALAPFTLVALQSYGGEMPLRVYLFSLPFVVVLIAGAELPRFARGGQAGVVGGVLLLLPAILLCRYGNEAFEAVQSADVAAAAAAYAAAGDDGTVLEANPFSPFRTERIDDIDYYAAGALSRPDLVDPIDVLASTGAPAVVVLVTSGQIAYAELVQGSPPGWSSALQARLVEAGGEVVFQDGEVFVVIVSDLEAP